MHKVRLVLVGSIAIAALGIAQIANSQTPVDGEVTKIDATAGKITMRHGPIKNLDMDAMNMVFRVQDPAMLKSLKVGDKVTITYAESFVYEVKKGGSVAHPETAVAGASAKPGMKPEGAIARQTTATVIITAIDRTAPSITFKGPAGNTRTIPVKRPEKLEGVNVGDTVEITYTEALAVKVQEAPPTK